MPKRRTFSGLSEREAMLPYGGRCRPKTDIHWRIIDPRKTGRELAQKSLARIDRRLNKEEGLAPKNA